MRYISSILFLVSLVADLSAQNGSENLQGSVSFISSQNIYVKFKSTEGISVGDTLYYTSAGKQVPGLIVNNLSSTSCICTATAGGNFSISQEITARKKSTGTRDATRQIKETIKETPKTQVLIDTVRRQVTKEAIRQKINGSLSAYSYSNFSNTVMPASTQFRYTLSLDAKEISGSKISVNTYLSFRHKYGDWSQVKSNIFSALKIFDLSVSFDPSKTMHISAGRKINSNISSIGAMDGLQIEKSISRFSLGVVAGFRPDYIDYGFNSKLFQFGAFAGYNSQSAEKFSQTSLAFMEQMNSAKTDRRFIYFQHSSSLLKNVFIFSTFEADLYKVQNNKPTSTFDLTSLYLSLRFRLTRNLSVTGSYDERKNVLFYETYKSLIDSVIQSQKRESYRLQANYRITKNLTAGFQSDYRFLKSDRHQSRNIYGYLTYSRIPVINVTATLSGTYLESNYINGRILGAKLSKDLLKGRLQADIGYQYLDYTLPEFKTTTLQNIGEAGIYWQITGKMSFSVNYEGTFEKTDKYNRLYIQLKRRF